MGVTYELEEIQVRCLVSFDAHRKDHQTLEKYEADDRICVYVSYPGQRVHVQVPDWLLQPEIGIYKHPEKEKWIVTCLQTGRRFGKKAEGDTRDAAIKGFIEICKEKGEFLFRQFLHTAKICVKEVGA